MAISVYQRIDTLVSKGWPIRTCGKHHPPLGGFKKILWFNMFQPYLEWLVGIFTHILMGSLNPSVDHVPIETSIEFMVFPLENWILHIHWCNVAQKFMVGIWGSSRFENSCGPSKPPHSLSLSGVSIQTAQFFLKHRLLIFKRYPLHPLVDLYSYGKIGKSSRTGPFSIARFVYWRVYVYLQETTISFRCFPSLPPILIHTWISWINWFIFSAWVYSLLQILNYIYKGLLKTQTDGSQDGSAQDKRFVTQLVELMETDDPRERVASWASQSERPDTVTFALLVLVKSDFRWNWNWGLPEMGVPQ